MLTWNMWYLSIPVSFLICFMFGWMNWRLRAGRPQPRFPKARFQKLSNWLLTALAVANMVLVIAESWRGIIGLAEWLVPAAAGDFYLGLLALIFGATAMAFLVGVGGYLITGHAYRWSRRRTMRRAKAQHAPQIESVTIEDRWSRRRFLRRFKAQYTPRQSTPKIKSVSIEIFEPGSTEPRHHRVWHSDSAVNQ